MEKPEETMQKLLKKSAEMMEKAMKGANASVKTAAKKPGEKMKKQRAALEVKASFSLISPEGKEKKGEAKIQLDKENLSVLPRFGEPVLVPVGSLASFLAKDYGIEFSLASGEKLRIYDLGYQYEDFLRIFGALRNELLIKERMMGEGSVLFRGDAEFRIEPEGKEFPGSVRLFDSAMVVIPEKGEFIRIPYNGMQVSEKGMVVEVCAGERKITIARLGDKFDAFSNSLSKAMSSLQLNAQKMIQAVLPSLDSMAIRHAAECIRDGKAANRQEMNACVPGLWEKLEQRLAATDAKDSYQFLKRIGSEQTRIGLKQGLGSGTSDYYFWFMVPVYSEDKAAPGNAIVLETAFRQGSKMATYLFRIVGRKEYPSMGEEEMRKQAKELLDEINNCLAEINFRREPIYLSEEKLALPEYAAYRAGVERLPELRRLRKLFIGRVAHTAQDAWEEAMKKLLLFNVSSKDDDEKPAGDYGAEADDGPQDDGGREG